MIQLQVLVLASLLVVTTSWITTAPSARSHHLSKTALSSSQLDAELGFLPKDVMAKFLSSIGGPIATSSLEAGLQAGVVTDEEISDVNANLDLSSELQPDNVIEEKWKEALQGQPWHIQTMGNMASSLVVSVVSNLQQKMKDQAAQMKWINDNALPVIQANSTVVDILGGGTLQFNNTRARYEDDRDVWSASMDVMAVGQSSDSIKSGLVNAYFTPSDDIKILVVEIDDYMHNLTWKGLS